MSELAEVPGRGLISRLLGTVPTLVVLSFAGYIGWWGHHHNWKLPKISELKHNLEESNDWCYEHNVPESECIECDPSLKPRPEFIGWCKLHGIPECTLCNPELAQLITTPKIFASELERAKRSLDFTERTENNPICRSHHRRIQFATSHDVEKSGIEVEPVWTAPALEFISAPGELAYDQTRVVHLSSRSTGIVWKVFKYLGQDVKAGDVLALIDATEVGKTKSELLQAVASHQLRLQTVSSIKESAGVVPNARLREAEAAVREAEIKISAGCQALTNLGLPLTEEEVRTFDFDQLKTRLQLLGIPSFIAQQLDLKTTTSNLLPLVAPMEGTVMSRDMVVGEVVDSNRILFELVDTRSLWLTFDLKGEDAHRVQLGQPVRFMPDNGRKELLGKVTWRSAQADPKTRTVKVRADFSDPERKQVANTFGSGRVILREEPAVISVPNEALHWEGCCHVVFIRDKDYLKADAPKLFHIRKVRLGAKNEKFTEVIAGVLPTELIVTKGSGLLLTELLRSELGEGCACCKPK
jgi:membrane fusion protein, heavy metal efflux system